MGLHQGDAISSSLKGKRVILKQDCLLFYHDSKTLRKLGAEFELTPKDPDNSWRKEGWIKVGSEVSIKDLKMVRVDTRGEWLAVFGEVFDPSVGADRTFFFCWSFGDNLIRAPWEDEGTPARRSISEVK
jgi:hypothetical protein